MSKQFKRDMSKDIDVAIAEKRAYDFLVRSQEAKQYIEDNIQEKLPGSSADLVTNLRDGQYLCRLANIFTNNSVKKIHQIKSGSLLEFMATDNLNNFFKACALIKFGEHNFFTIPDIWEKKNIVKVVACVHALAHYCTKHQISKVKIKDLSKVGLKFDEEEIKKTKEELDKLDDDPGAKPMIAPPSRHDMEDEEGDDEGSEDLELADPDECVVEGEGISKAIAGETATAKITAKDNLGNTIEVGGEEFSAILFSKSDKKVKVAGKIKDNEDGTYSITYVPEIAGDYQLEVYLHDIQDEEDTDDFEKMLLKGCPFSVHVSAATKSDPTKLSLDGIGASNSTAGTETSFSIQSYDAFGNKGNGGEKYTVTLSSHDGTTVEANVKDAGNGLYEVSYTAPKSGEYDLSIKVGDQSYGKDQKISVKDAGISEPDNTSIEGCSLDGVNTLLAGETFKFTVLGKDKHGNERESGGEKFTATLISTTMGNKHALHLTKILEDPNDETIEKIFKKYDKDANSFIDRNEFELFAKEVSSYVDHKKSQSILDFNSFDKNDDDKISLEEFTSHIKKLDEQQVIRTALGDKHSVALKSIIGSSAEEVFKKYDADSNGFIDRNEFEAFVLDVTNLAQNESLLSFSAYDTNNDNQISLEEFTRHIQKLAQEQLGDSTIGNKYALALNTLLGDVNDETNIKNLFSKYDKNGNGYIEKDEFDAFVKEVSEIIKSQVESNKDNKSATLLNFDSYDKNNDNEITLEEFVAHIKSLEKDQTITSMLGNKSAIALSKVLENSDDLQKLFKKYDKDGNNTISRSEFAAFVSDVIDAAEQENLLTFEAYDKNRDDSISLEEFTDHIQKLAKEQIFVSVGNKYALALNTLLGGPEYSFNVKSLFKKYDTNGDNLIDKQEFSKFVQDVKGLVEDEPAIVSREKYEEYTKRKQIAQSLLNFSAYDTNDDNKISLDEFKSHIQKLSKQQPTRSTEIPVVDLQNGRYDGTVTLKNAGDYEIQVKLDGKNVGEPIKIHVDPIEKTDTKSCTFTTKADIQQIKAGSTTKFVIESRDEFGNLRNKGGETFTTRITSKTKKEILEDKVHTKDNGNGTYDVTFDLQEAGDYALEVLLGDDYVQGFPIENITIKESGKTDPKRNVVDGEGLHDGTSKKPGQFTITTYDEFGNLRTSGGDKISVKFSNKQKNLSFEGEVTDLGDGTYEVNYLYEVPVDTEFEVDIVHNGVNFFEKPQIMKLKGLKIKEIAEDQLLVIQDHDLLNSLLNLFKEEETESYIGKIQDIREKLISQIKVNFGLESDVKDVEKKIELLIQNRIKAEEVHAKKKTKKKEVVESTMKENDTTKYSHLFYLLQTQPKYLSTCLYMVPPEKVETFLETVILTLYGYAFSAREEYLILNLFKQALQLEVERDNKKVGSFLNNNPVLPKMVMTYGRRLQGKTYLQKVLFDKIIDPILKIKKLDLELNAVKLLKTYLSDQEVETGVKNVDIDVKTLTYERAMKEEHIATKINERIAKLSEICSGVLQGMADYVDEMPYGLRYVCKQLDQMLLEKHKSSTESERASVIGYIVYYRFMNPALVSPDGFELTKDPIKPVMRTNLILISKVMTNLSNNARFDKKLEEHMTVMNDWLEKNESPYVDFIRKLTNVQDPEDSLGVDEYMELTQKTNPTITIKWNEIFLTHAVLLKYLHKLATDKDDPLKIILSEPGMDKAPDELPKDQDEEIKLPLINRFAEKTTKASATADQLYDSAKESFRTILKSLPTDQIGTSVKDTLSVAKKYAEKDPNNETSKSILASVNQIQTVLPVLIENGKVQEKTEYREIIVDITREIQSAKVLLIKHKKEYERLKDSLASLEGHQKFLEEKIEDFKSYVTQSVVNDVVPSKKTHKFTYAQLEKKGVIKDMTVMKSQRNRVKFNISMETPGVFKVDAKVGGITVKTIEIKLEELLAMKARGNDKLDYEYVILDVNMTLHVMNKLFMQSK